MHSMQKHPIILGTAILTSAGLLCRLMGFFYRIYISRIFNAEGMGVFGMIMPIAGLLYALTGGCFQTCISKFVGEEKRGGQRPFLIGLSLSLPLALLLSILLYFFADPISNFWLQEKRCAPLLRALSLSVLPAAIHSCIKGYYYGRQKTLPPALSQIIEQLVRIGTIFFLVSKNRQGDPPLVIMVYGMVLGEFASLIFSLLTLLLHALLQGPAVTARSPKGGCRSFLSMLLPLCLNRIILNVLQSMETVAIPTALTHYGYSRSQALSLYGIITGMVMPLLLFPTTLTGSVSALLLPSVSEYQSHGEMKKISLVLRKNLFFCLLLGAGSVLFFFYLGPYIGTHIYDNEAAGTYIRIASFISPFLYLNSTLSGILQGLGKTPALFMINLSCLLCRLLLIWLTIPLFGIQAYLFILLFTHLMQFLLFYRLTITQCH